MPGQVTKSSPNEIWAPRRVLDRDVLVLGILAMLCSLVGMIAFQDPPRVDRLEVVNPSGYDVSIHARSLDETSTVAVGTIRGGSSRVFERVIDQGDTWVFVMRSQGRPGSETVITRAELADAEWTLKVPDEVVGALEAQGATPPR